MTLRIQIFGVNELKGALLDLPRSIQNKTMRIALNAGAGVVRDAAVARAPKETGLLGRAQKIKVKIPNASYNVAHHGKPAYAVIGTSRRVVSAVGRTAQGKVRRISDKRATKIVLGGGRVMTRAPSRYAHLAGTQRTRWFKSAASSSGSAAKAKVVAKLNQGISEWAARRRVSA
jgi:hypothetical protein